MKQIRAFLLCALILALLAGCGEKAGDPLKLSVSLSTEPVSADPARVVDAGNATILEHLYENLMRPAVDVTGAVTTAAGIAKSYEMDEKYDGTVTYTFHLRSNAKWSDGTKVTAQDFVYAWQRLVSPATGSPNHAMLEMLRGYDEVRAGGDLEKLAVRAKNDTTLLVGLSYPCPFFLSDICTNSATMPLRADVTAREGWDSDWKNLPTNGAYCVGELREGKSLLAVRNGQYDENRTAGPDELEFVFADTAAEAFALYESKTVDCVSPLPEEELAALSKNDGWKAHPTLGTYSVLFNNLKAPFHDPRVRQAFSLVVDRSKLAPLVSSAATVSTALVPVGVPQGEQDFRTTGGERSALTPTEEDCRKARALLAEAGYPNGEDFPAVRYFFADSESNRAVAEELSATWKKELNITVEPLAGEPAQLRAALASGEYTLAAKTVSSPVRDAFGFLNSWASKEARNVLGYRNSAFDTLLVVIEAASDEAARYACLHDAETLLLDDAALLPLYSAGTAYRLRESFSGAFLSNSGHLMLGAVTRANAA